MNLSEFFGIEVEHDTIDLYIFSLQELITVDNVSKNPKPMDLRNFGIWKQELLSFLNNQRKESKVELFWDGNQGGTMLLYYVRENLKDHIKNTKTMTVECSRSKSTIKGAVCIRFEIGQRSYSFASVHLTADQETENYEARIKDYHKVANSHYENDLGFEAHDFVCWTGDMNFRVNLKRSDILKRVEEKNFSELLLHDQLVIARREGLAFTGYNEGIVTFPPSFRYTIGALSLSLEDPPDKRVPAYTDRILFKNSEHLQATLDVYSMGSLTASDHRPVSAIFTLSSK